MKTILTSIILLVNVCFLSAQTWSSEQLANANTAYDIDVLSQEEKDVIMYINLARLYPKEFAEYEVKDYYGPEEYGGYLEHSSYRASLIEQLRSMEPVPALNFDISLFEYAKCFAKEQGEEGYTGHERKECADGNFAECCSYGMETGLDIALQWLIDHDVPSLGHRDNCLNAEYTIIGLSIHSHKKWDWCCVADMIW